MAGSKTLGSTFPIIAGRVGAGGTTHGDDVRRIQQLLCRTGNLARNQITGNWKGTGTGTSPTLKAWMEFQEKCGMKPVDYIDPKELNPDRLANLAIGAGVLMVVPEKMRSASACLNFTNMSIVTEIPYAWQEPSGVVHNGGSKAVHGFEGRPWAIVFTRSKFFDIDTEEPRGFNCTSFANLMISIWRQGNAHSTPYDAYQGVGGLGDQLGPRFSMPELKTKKGNWIFRNVEEIEEQVQPGRIYQFLLCLNNTGFTKHDTVYFDGNIYQANKPGASPNRGAVYVQPLRDVWKKMQYKGARMYGPGPF
jgi:hypothetical protein